jgi:lipopolysaccharide transport system permease protein
LGLRISCNRYSRRKRKGVSPMSAGSIREKIKSFYAYRHSLWAMAVKQFRAKYAGSAFGVLWALINPLLMMCAITFVFTVVFKSAEPYFGLFVLSGILPWMFFSGALSETAPAFIHQKGVLHQFSLPKEIIPLSVTLAYFLNFLVSWCFMYPVFVFHEPRILALAFYLPGLIVCTYLFTSGIGLLCCVANCLYRDVEHLLGILLMFWFWVTPVFYTVDMVPAGLRWIFRLNPMVPFIVSFQDLVFRCRAPSMAACAEVAVWTAVSVCGAVAVSTRWEARILKRI